MDPFLNSIKEAAQILQKINSPIRVISHLDADGLTAASIMVKTLTKLDKIFSLSIVKQISPQLLSELKKEQYENYIFLDTGSGNLKEIDQALKNRTIFILDHHAPQDYKNSFIHINPHLHKINGSLEISGAGVTYLFSKELDSSNKELAYLALLGAIGDSQEAKNGFTGLNKEILNDALSTGKLEVITGLRMFGSQTRPLYKVLEYSTDPYIPGITGNEQAAIAFLDEINIDQNRKLFNLSEDELKNLVAAIIIKRMGSETDPEDVLGNIYLLKDQPRESPTKELKEFSTLLNSCGRLNKSSLGIGTCLNDKNCYEAAISLLAEYKKELIDSLNWFYKNKNSNLIIETQGLVIINAEDKIRDTLIGTVTSMIAKSNIYQPGTILISLAHTLEADTKISIRISGRGQNVDLREILNNIAVKIGCQAGGHAYAAGSIIPQEKEREFISSALETFKKPAETFINTIQGN